jgi:predicted  nucleic acid-binding Zn-ribbon protein
MAKKPVGKVVGKRADQYMLRFPEGMRENLAKLATANGRSMNTEIIAALEKHLERDDKISKLEQDIDQLRLKFEDIEAKLKDVLSRMSRSETAFAEVRAAVAR